MAHATPNGGVSATSRMFRKECRNPKCIHRNKN
jgi:hypothetical protein